MESENRLERAQVKVDQVKVQMQDNVKKMIQNQGDALELEDKSRDIQQNAFNIRNQAKRIEKEAILRNRRLKILIGVVVLIFTFYMVGPIFTDDATDSDQTTIN